MSILRSQRGFVLLAVAVVIMLALSSNALTAADRRDCVTVVGKVADQALPQCPAGVNSPLCTFGHVIGVLSGTYDFALATQDPAPGIPTVGLFTAKSTIHTKKGDLFLAEAGSVDGVTGNLADLWTITGGTGKWEGATGQVFAVGNFSFAKGVGEVLYSGEVCTPK